MVSSSQMKATKKYEDKVYFKVLVRFNKKDEEAIRSSAEASGMSVNKFIVESVKKSIKTY